MIDFELGMEFAINIKTDEGEDWLVENSSIISDKTLSLIMRDVGNHVDNLKLERNEQWVIFMKNIMVN